MFVSPHLIGNAAGHDRVVSTMRLDLTETAAAKAQYTKCNFCRILVAGLTHRKYGLEECLESAASAEISSPIV